MNVSRASKLTASMASRNVELNAAIKLVGILEMNPTVSTSNAVRLHGSLHA